LQKRERKSEKKLVIQEYTRKKSERSEKLHISIKRGIKCAYTKKNDFSLEVITAILEAF